ncbi:MAG: DNA gyrase inhibitor YacG [bacterium]
MATAVPSAPRCPTCRTPVEWAGNPHRPFCSQRCRMVDLGDWAAERHRVPGESIPGDDESSDGEPH